VRACAVGSSRELQKPRILAVPHHLLTFGVVRAIRGLFAHLVAVFSPELVAFQAVNTF
jgi:hypothetical protein